MKGIGQKIKEIRKIKGLSQEELADSASVNLRTIQRIESGNNEPRGKTLNLICVALDINVEDILDYGKESDRGYLVLFHLSVLSFIALPIGNLILPLVLWLTKKDKIVDLKDVGSNVLNFQILWTVITTLLLMGFAVLKILNHSFSEVALYLCGGLFLVNMFLPIRLCR